MPAKSYCVVIERDPDGIYVGTVPQLLGCHSQASSLDELMTRIAEAIALCIEDETETDGQSEFVGIQQIAV